MAQTAKLVICDSRRNISQVPVSEDTVYIGCRKKGGPAEVQINCPFMGELHGKLSREENKYTYKDLGTEYGTYFNNDIKIGGPLTDGEHHVKLEDGDVLRVDNPRDGKRNRKAAVIIFREKFDPKVEWKALSLADRSQNYYLSCREESVGEEIQSREGEGELPRRYAFLTYDGQNWAVDEHNTKFGIYVNGELVEKHRVLNYLDVVRIGRTLFLFLGDRLMYNHHEAAGNRLSIHIEERSVWNLFRRRMLLQDINLSVNPGEMVLVLGGSGAGKTTFINAVMGYEKAQGTISLDGVDVYKNYNRMKYEIGFVPQQDWLRMDDSVLATLSNAAELKLPKSVPEEERKKRVEEVLETLGLESEKKSLVSKLSGGQRKRLSIAVEYIVNPSLFFLDEPDSGLDGVMARHLMESLRTIADQGKTVIVITHSPDRVIDLFDKVIVLAKDSEKNVGHLAFYGSPGEARRFFEVDTMEDVVRKINRKDEGGEGMADFYIEKYQETERKMSDGNTEYSQAGTPDADQSLCGEILPDIC
ncbi:MAG: ATP-binding cassette domain-containing protein [Ruminococcus sp.]|jgi:ABC-type multidrug transport system ATPase subunit